MHDMPIYFHFMVEYFISPFLEWKSLGTSTTLIQSLPSTSEMSVACDAIGGLINVFVSSSVELYSYMFMYACIKMNKYLSF